MSVDFGHTEARCVSSASLTIPAISRWASPSPALRHGPGLHKVRTQRPFEEHMLADVQRGLHQSAVLGHFHCDHDRSISGRAANSAGSSVKKATPNFSPTALALFLDEAASLDEPSEGIQPTVVESHRAGHADDQQGARHRHPVRRTEQRHGSWQ
jgi:hypothetical protein